MSIRTSLIKLVDRYRALTGPDHFDLRTNQLTIRTRRWSGGQVELGDPIDSDLVLPAIYPVRYLTAHELRTAAGRYELVDILVDHITPSDGNGTGYTQEQLYPTVTDNGTEIIYILTGTHAGEYRCMDIRTYRPFTYQLVIRRRDLS